jgi:hypothetical protein
MGCGSFFLGFSQYSGVDVAWLNEICQGTEHQIEKGEEITMGSMKKRRKTQL